MAAEAPDAPAVYDGVGPSLTYAELAQATAQLSWRLGDAGVTTGDVVAVVVAAPVNLAVAFMAVLDAGGAYLPIDPSYPKGQIAEMVGAARPTAVVAGADVAAAMLQAMAPEGPGPAVVDPSTRSRFGLRPDASTAPEGGNVAGSAYVVFTSGSTGRPKGIVVDSCSLAAHGASARDVYQLGPGDNVLALGSPAFDASIEQLVGPLTAGAAVTTRGPEILTPSELVARARQAGITVIDMPTAYWHQLDLATFTEDLVSTSVRLLILGGEALSCKHLDMLRERWGGRIRVVNAYGPAEAVITATSQDVLDATSASGISCPIGRPWPARLAYVLDGAMEPVAAGETGELYVGGEPLALGYLGDPAATAASYLPDPCAPKPGGRMYRTGDLVRADAEGRLEFLGRIDDQVKLRGFRVSLDSLERTIADLDGVRAAAVTFSAGTSGVASRLGAYVAMEPGSVMTPSALRSVMQAALPSHMVPNDISVVSELPLGPSGKVSRTPPAPAGARAPRPEVSAPFRPPADAAEGLLADIWAETLGVLAVGVEDDFFELGGTSLQAVEVCERAHRAGLAGLSTRAVLSGRSVRRALAGVGPGSGADVPTMPPLPTATVDGPIPLSEQQWSIWFMEQMNPGSGAYHFHDRIRVTGPLELSRLRRALNRVVERHEIFRTTFGISGGRPFQAVRPDGTIKLEVVDLTDVEPADLERRLDETQKRVLGEPFDLESGPLIRWTLVRFQPELHWLLHSEHHLVHDGWSYRIFLDELNRLYGRDDDLPDADPMQYRHYVAWQQDWLAGAGGERQRSFWLETLAGAPEQSTLAERRLGRGGAAPGPHIIRRQIDVDLADLLRAAARRMGESLFSLTLAAFALQVAGAAGLPEVVVGTAVANRRMSGSAEVAGMFVNTIALRLTGLDADPGVGAFDLVRGVGEVVASALEHQEYPFTHVVRHLKLRRSGTTNPVFQVGFHFDDRQTGEPDGEVLFSAEEGEIHSGVAKFDINVVVVPRTIGREMTIIWEYDWKKYDMDYMEDFVSTYVSYLQLLCHQSLGFEASAVEAQTDGTPLGKRP